MSDGYEFDWERYLDTHCGVCGREYYYCDCGETDEPSGPQPDYYAYQRENEATTVQWGVE